MTSVFKKLLNMRHDFSQLLPAQGLVSFIGGGGKSGFMERVEEERHKQGLVSLVTVSTRLGRWQFPALEHVEALSENEARAALKKAGEGRRVLLAGPPAEDDLRLNKYNGIPSAWFSGLKAGLPPSGLILIEADGSAGLPVKAHRAGEPPLPFETDFMVGIVGLSALKMPWAETIHRPEFFAEYCPLPLEKRPLKPGELAGFILKAWSSLNIDLLFFNQLDLLGNEYAVLLEQLLKALNGFPSAVVLGSLKDGFYCLPGVKHN